MSQRFLGGATALTCGAYFLFCLLVVVKPTPAPATGGKETPGAGDKRPAGSVPEASGKDVFGATKVLGIHLEIPTAEYEAMQPAPGGFGFPGGPPKGPAPKQPKDKRDGERNLFGTVFPWAHADCTALGKTY